MMANFHAALAGGGSLVEWPIPVFPLRKAMIVKPWRIENGLLELLDTPGLGVQLTKSIEKKYPFRAAAVYTCLTDSFSMSQEDIWE